MSSIPVWRRLSLVVLTSIAILTAPLGNGVLATAQQPAATTDESSFDPQQLFASICGFCHSDGGRKAGKGPQLMNTKRSDDFIVNRIKNGKEGAMPAFGASFNDAQIAQIVKYIRSLKPD
jgi:mono/diheme cytochrome c family protein